MHVYCQFYVFSFQKHFPSCTAAVSFLSPLSDCLPWNVCTFFFSHASVSLFLPSPLRALSPLSPACLGHRFDKIFECCSGKGIFAAAFKSFIKTVPFSFLFVNRSCEISSFRSDLHNWSVQQEVGCRWIRSPQTFLSQLWRTAGQRRGTSESDANFCGHWMMPMLWCGGRADKISNKLAGDVACLGGSNDRASAAFAGVPGLIPGWGVYDFSVSAKASLPIPFLWSLPLPFPFPLPLTFHLRLQRALHIYLIKRTSLSGYCAFAFIPLKKHRRRIVKRNKSLYWSNS